jgi:hypothetical protein
MPIPDGDLPGPWPAGIAPEAAARRDRPASTAARRLRLILGPGPAGIPHPIRPPAAEVVDLARWRATRLPTGASAPNSSPGAGIPGAAAASGGRADPETTMEVPEDTT